jgi:hypothetical protein
MWFLSPGQSGWGMKLATYLHILLRLRIHGTVLPVTSTCSCLVLFTSVSSYPAGAEIFVFAITAILAVGHIHTGSCPVSFLQ